MDINDIKINKKKPRKISPEKLKKLKKSLEGFKKMMSLRPIITDEEGTILGGNMRYQALQQLGYKTIPDEWVKKADDLTEEEKKEFILKDNIGFGEWDFDILFDNYNFSDLDDWGMDVPEHIKDKKIKVKEDNYEIPDKIKSNIRIGDIYKIGSHILLCGDSTKPEFIRKAMNGNKADLVIADPPYNVDYTGKTQDALKIKNDNMQDDIFYRFLLDFQTALKPHSKPGSAWYVFHADTEGLIFRNAFKNAGLDLKQCLIWVKNTFVMGRQDYQWKHEPILYGYMPGGAHYFIPERNRTTVYEDAIDFKKLKKDELLKILEEIYSDKIKTTVINHKKPAMSREHPTMKPILLLAELIKNSSKQGQLIVDPFLGSGSTMVAAHQLKRVCIGIEYDPKYCQVVLDRMQKLDPEININKIK